jgi:hypothetical protein
MISQQIKIGDKLNYEERGWTSRVIEGETKQSWLMDTGAKVNKKTLLSKNGRYLPTLWYADKQRDDKCWITTNRYRIESEVRACNDRATLEKIDNLL